MFINIIQLRNVPPRTFLSGITRRRFEVHTYFAVMESRWDIRAMGILLERKISYLPNLSIKTNHFKSTDSLKHYFSPAAGAKEVVTYCFIGQTASVVYMAGRILGFNMKLYDGSMQEWSRFDELPMEKTQK